jgi:hypothetical protein
MRSLTKPTPPYNYQAAVRCSAQLPRHSPRGEIKGLVWWLLGSKDRPIVPQDALVHESVQIRRDQLDYRPRELPVNPPYEPWPHDRGGN